MERDKIRTVHINFFGTVRLGNFVSDLEIDGWQIGINYPVTGAEQKSSKIHSIIFENLFFWRGIKQVEWKQVILHFHNMNNERVINSSLLSP